jgi:hypothetical protein
LPFLFRFFRVPCGCPQDVGAEDLGDPSPRPPGIYRFRATAACPESREGTTASSDHPLLRRRR